MNKEEIRNRCASCHKVKNYQLAYNLCKRCYNQEYRYGVCNYDLPTAEQFRLIDREYERLSQ